MQKKYQKISFDLFLKDLFNIKEKQTRISLYPSMSHVRGNVNYCKEVLEGINTDTKQKTDNHVVSWQDKVGKAAKIKRKTTSRKENKINLAGLAKHNDLSLVVRARRELAKREKIELLKREPVALATLTSFLLVMIFSFSMALLAPVHAEKLSAVISEIYTYPLTKLSTLIFPSNNLRINNFHLDPKLVTKEIKSAYIRNNIDTLSKINPQITKINITSFQLSGQVAGVATENRPKDVSVLKIWRKGISDSVFNFYERLAQKQRNIADTLNNKLTNFLLK